MGAPQSRWYTEALLQDVLRFVQLAEEKYVSVRDVQEHFALSENRARTVLSIVADGYILPKEPVTNRRRFVVRPDAQACIAVAAAATPVIRQAAAQALPRPTPDIWPGRYPHDYDVDNLGRISLRRR